MLPALFFPLDARSDDREAELRAELEEDAPDRERTATDPDLSLEELAERALDAARAAGSDPTALRAATSRLVDLSRRSELPGPTRQELLRAARRLQRMEATIDDDATQMDLGDDSQGEGEQGEGGDEGGFAVRSQQDELEEVPAPERARLARFLPRALPRRTSTWSPSSRPSARGSAAGGG